MNLFFLYRERDKTARVMGPFHETYDVYLIPTGAYPSVRIGELKPRTAETVLIKFVNTLRLGGLLKASGIFYKPAV